LRIPATDGFSLAASHPFATFLAAQGFEVP